MPRVTVICCIFYISSSDWVRNFNEWQVSLLKECNFKDYQWPEFFHLLSLTHFSLQFIMHEHSASHNCCFAFPLRHFLHSHSLTSLFSILSLSHSLTHSPSSLQPPFQHSSRRLKNCSFFADDFSGLYHPFPQQIFRNIFF